jgi:hypothetical protein
MIRLKSATMSFLSSGKFFCALVLVALSSVGCNKSQQSAAPTGPQTFASADVAGQAIYGAAKAGDTNALLAIFGSGAKELLLSGDPVQDKAALDTFSQKYDEMHRWGKLTQGGLVLDVGAENYPFPFALRTNSSGEWYFDTSSAKAEILARRIGDNELSTIELLNAMKDAQAEYFSQLHDGAKAHAYAQKFVSDDGKQDGLYTSGSQEQQPYQGYYFRMITKQGPAAQGGAKDYVVNGTMTGGFAILAYPAEYGNSGVMSFVINQDGNVFEKDLGANTTEAAKGITSYDPDSTWSAVE